MVIIIIVMINIIHKFIKKVISAMNRVYKLIIKGENELV